MRPFCPDLLVRGRCHVCTEHRLSSRPRAVPYLKPTSPERPIGRVIASCPYSHNVNVSVSRAHIATVFSPSLRFHGVRLRSPFANPRSPGSHAKSPHSFSTGLEGSFQRSRDWLHRPAPAGPHRLWLSNSYVKFTVRGRVCNPNFQYGLSVEASQGKIIVATKTPRRFWPHWGCLASPGSRTTAFTATNIARARLKMYAPSK